MNEADRVLAVNLIDLACNAERFALMLETQNVDNHLNHCAVGRPSEIRLVATLAIVDVRTAIRRDFDAHVSLGPYLDELHAALRDRRIFAPPCCGSYTANAHPGETP